MPTRPAHDPITELTAASALPAYFLSNRRTARRIANPIPVYDDGYAAGYDVGLDDGYDDGYPVGFADGVASVPGKDLTAPVVTVTTLPTTSEEPVVIQAYDLDPGLQLVDITCQDRSDGPKVTVYDAGGFYHPFRGTVTGSGTQVDPYVFTVYRRGRWPTGISLASFKVRAIDEDGNLQEVSA